MRNVAGLSDRSRSTERPVLVESRPGGIALVTMNRPAYGNGVVPEMAVELLDVLNQLDADRSIRAAILTGAGEHFSAGADLFALKAYLEEQLLVLEEPFNARVLFPVTQKIVGCRFPIVAAINGSATAGGLDLALACDVRVASTDAKLGETYVKIGLAPGNGGTYFLPRLVGSGHAAELALTGDIISAQRALDIGLVNYVVAPEDVLTVAFEVARKIAANPPHAVEATKQALRASWQFDLQHALDFGYWTAAALHYSADLKANVEAFIERRGGRRSADPATGPEDGRPEDRSGG